MSEKELWNKLRSGESSALENIYRNYFSDLYRYGQNFTKDFSKIEDCIQEMFVDLWNSRERLSETDAIKPYLYVSLKRRLFQASKQEKKTIDFEIADMNFKSELAIDEILINKEIQAEKKAAIKEAFTNLSDRQREILYLKYYSDMSYAEISEIMDLNYQSARNLVSRALLKLSKYIITLILLAIFGCK